MKCSLSISDFLEELQVFLILLFSSIFFFYFLHCSFRKAFLFLIAILLNSAFRWIYLYFSTLPFASLVFSLVCKAFSDNHFALLHFLDFKGHLNYSLTHSAYL